VHLVAIAPRPDCGQDVADELARLTGLSIYEARTRLRVLGGGPGVLATFGEKDHAVAVADAAQRLGLPAWVVRGQPGETRRVVRRFVIRGGHLTVVVEDGQTLTAQTSHVRLLLAGLRYSLHTEWSHERSKPDGAMARAAIGFRVGGTTPVRSRAETRESFVLLYSPGMPTLVFAVGSLQYHAPDRRPLAATRTANFAIVVRQLREACTAARWDDRLQQRGEQARMLGPTLRPERNLDVAIALLNRDIGRERDPYR